MSDVEPSGTGLEYAVLLSPPNLTGELHIGHGLNYVLLDTLIRFEKKQGKRAVCPPGTEQPVARVGHQYKKYRERCGDAARSFEQWKDAIDSGIRSTMKGLGLDVDWNQTWSSLDERRGAFASDAFSILQRRGGIARKHELCTYCPQCACSLSDMDIPFVQRRRKKYLLAFTLRQGKSVRVPLWRPETILACTALGIPSDHPDYEYLKDRKVFIPLLEREVPVVKLDSSEGLGPGELRIIAPLLNSVDFYGGDKDRLAPIYNADGTLNCSIAELNGLDIGTARMRIVDKLDELGLIADAQDQAYDEPRCAICGHEVLARPGYRYFIDFQRAAQDLLSAEHEGHIVFNNPIWERGYKVWLSKLIQPEINQWWDGLSLRRFSGYSTNKGWMVSYEAERGPKVPTRICATCCGVQSLAEHQPACLYCGGQRWHAETEVINGIFSSIAAPMSLFSHADKNCVFDLAVCGNDIYLYWVTLINLLSVLLYKKVGIREVVVHGLVVDEHGEKMSKSKDNAMPLQELVDAAGVDAMRALVYQAIGERADYDAYVFRPDLVHEVKHDLELIARVVGNGRAGPTGAESIAGELQELHLRVSDGLARRLVGDAYKTFLAAVRALDAQRVQLDAHDKKTLLDLLDVFHPALSAQLRAAVG